MKDDNITSIVVVDPLLKTKVKKVPQEINKIFRHFNLRDIFVNFVNKQIIVYDSFLQTNNRKTEKNIRTRL
ncbi:hypothetical protein AGMMS49944_08230 [Spirochaetia bacterium]|nr:hypothetical protein AGMMS49944_08230 [Spirochaetia bacterium]